MFRYLLIVCIVAFSMVLNAQELSGHYFKIKGKVIDEASGSSIEYASVMLFNKKDSSLVVGTTSNKKGHFVLGNIKQGDYYLECRFLSYRKYCVDSLCCASSKIIDLGEIPLEISIQNIAEVNVETERKRVEYKIDKKIINVGKDITSAGGTAVDLLENVPSIKTDLQGNVYLRGADFTLLVDGKPTVMSSKDLKFIQASTIDKIEIITNPSAKYSPEGIAGIINIVTKKDKIHGLNAALNMSVGTFDKYGINARLNYRLNRFRLIGGFSYQNRMMYNQSFEDKTTFLDSTTNYFNTEYDNRKQSVDKSAKIGLDYFLTESTSVGFYFKYQDRARDTRNLSYIRQYLNENKSDLFLKNVFKEDYSGKYFNLNLNFNHHFKGEHHVLTGYTYFTNFKYSIENSLEIDTTDAYFSDKNRWSDRLKKIEDNTYFRNISQLDYSLPLGKYAMLEAGYSFSFVKDNSTNDNLFFNNNENKWVELSDKNNLFLYSKQIHGIYGVVESSLKNLTYKVGLRIEHYTRTTAQKAIGNEYVLSKLDFFPTVHLQYDISENNKIQTSYTKRINRFWGTQLNPFPIILDANNVAKGNPEIQPEYINSFELDYLYYFKSSYCSLELYHRRTDNLLGNIQVLQANGNILHTYENLNRDYSTGLELMLNMTLYKWWLVNTSFDYFRYRIVGQLHNNAIDNSHNSYDFRLQNTFNLKHSVRILLTAYYSAPSIYVQEELDGYYRIGIAIQKSFLKRKLNLTIRMQDIFNTSILESKKVGKNYIIYDRSSLKYPLIYLQLAYKLGE